MWDGTKIRAFKNQCTEEFGQRAPFNLVTAAIVADRIFSRHPTVKKLNLGLTVYFPFLESRNKYGVQMRTVKRDTLKGLVKQLMKKQASPVATCKLPLLKPRLCTQSSPQQVVYELDAIFSKADRCADCQCACGTSCGYGR